MTRAILCPLLLVPLLCLAEAPPPATIAREPAYAPSQGERLTQLPRHTASGNPFEVDLRGDDCSALDLSTRADDLACASYDSTTHWPADAAKLPPAFDPAKVMELGKNPGLGVRSLHARGITGRGVSVAVVDQTLPVHHAEFAGRLRLYAEVGMDELKRWESGDYVYASMHGAATASILAGRTVGVAPETDLYHIATTACDLKALDGKALNNGPPPMTFVGYAAAVRRVLEINRTLPPERKIRVISLSIGWTKGQPGYDDVTAAVAEARKQNVLVTSSSLAETFGFNFNGAGRDPMADPDDFASYRPGTFWADRFYATPNHPRLAGMLLVPMDHRTTAGPGAPDQYAHYGTGGWSWCTPYLAGLYALACQVDPAMTPDRFFQAALATRHPIKVTHDGKTHTLHLIDPVALIDSLGNVPAAAGR